MQALEHEIKELIISSLSLEDISPDDIDTGAPLFVEGLGLDSIDALGHFSKPPSPLQPVSRHDVAHDHPAHQALVFLASPAWR